VPIELMETNDHLNLKENPTTDAIISKSLGSTAFHYSIPRFALPI
jgi:hypothetical protein